MSQGALMYLNIDGSRLDKWDKECFGPMLMYLMDKIVEIVDRIANFNAHKII